MSKRKVLRVMGPKGDQSRDPETGLTALQMKLMPLLLTSISYAEASVKAGLSEQAVSQMCRRDHFFREAIHKARREAYAHTLWGAQQAAAEALNVFREGMRHKDMRLRISAAREVTAMAKAGFEALDLVDAIEELKATARELTERNSPA